MFRKKALALLTAAGMLFGNAAVFPTIAVSAAGEGTTPVTLTPNVTKTIAFTGQLNEETGENEMAWANLGDDTYDPMSAIRAAAAPQLGCSADDVAVEDITVTYDYAFTTEDGGLTAGDAGIGLDVYGSCMNTAGVTSDLSTDTVSLNDSLTGTDKTVTFSSFYPAGTTIDMIWYFSIGIHGNGKQGESLTLTVKKIEASVKYEKSYNEIDIPYSELQGKEAIKFTYNAGKANECGHSAGDHGAGFSGTYCPYAGVSVYCVSSNGSQGGEEMEYWLSTGEDKAVITTVVLLKDIYAKTGTPSAGDTLVFYGSSIGEPVSYELIANYVPEDIVLNTGSVSSGTIQEGSDWDSTTNSAVPNGKPDLTIGTVRSLETKQSLTGYKTLRISYTLSNPSAVSQIAVHLGGWDANGIGYVEKYYAAGSSGTIIIDLSEYQGKYVSLIEAGPVALSTAKIGDTVAPGFNVTSAKLITSEASATETVEPTEPEDSNGLEFTAAQLSGVKYFEVTFTPNAVDWAGVIVYRVPGGDYDSIDWDSGYEGASVLSPDGSSSYTVVASLSDILAKVGTLGNNDLLVFQSSGDDGNGNDVRSFTVKPLTKLPDVVLNTGSVTSGTIKEGSDWDNATNSAVPNGKPDLTIGTVRSLETTQKLNGYKALRISYTLSDPRTVSQIAVHLGGWEADGIGYVEKYYAAGSSGTITVDLSAYQGKSVSLIEAGPVALSTAKIGDTVTPGFSVTSAKLITEYDGSFSSEIPAEKPDEGQPSNPSSPSIPSTPSTPSAPSSSLAGSQNTSVSVTEKAVEEINKATEGTTVNISLKGSTVADKEILIAIAGKDIDIKVTISGGVTVEINGMDVENAKNVDLGVKMNSNAVKEERVNEIAKDKDTTQFSLKHNGDFGFKATFNLPVNKRYNGKYANIYWDNNGKLEFAGSSIVKNSSIAYCTYHASDYVIVFDDYAYGEDVSSAAGIYADGEHGESASYVIFAAVVLMIGVSAITIKKFIVKSK